MMFGIGRARDALRARNAAERERLWRDVAALQAAELAAAASEDFHAAAAARDRADKLRMRDPHVRVQRRLAAAVEAERFMQAARLRDTLARLTPPPVLLTNADADFGGWRSRAQWRESTTTTTNGVRVCVDARFDADRSDAQRGARAVFRVRCEVRNDSDSAVQIVGRRYTIAEFASGAEKVAEGCGVGAARSMPVLAPGDEFSFETAVPVAVLGLAAPAVTPASVAVAAGAATAAVAVAPVAVPVEYRTSGTQPLVAVGAFSGALELVSGELGECAWDAPVAESLLMLPA